MYTFVSDNFSKYFLFFFSLKAEPTLSDSKWTMSQTHFGGALVVHKNQFTESQPALPK